LILQIQIQIKLKKTPKLRKKKLSYAETISEAMKKQREENRKKRIEEDYKYGIEVPGLN
jgi:tRNA A-37 threonylcarbamoyl transferase component Bud32